jgi:hypothetical protein
MDIAVTQVTVQDRAWKVSVRGIDPSATFAPTSTLRRSLVLNSDRETSAEVLSVMVEVFRSGSGILPRALIGGTFEPGGSDLITEVWASGPITLNAPRTCESTLAGPLVPGLPDEFAEVCVDAVLDASQGLCNGKLTISVGGFDEMNSSPIAFRHASEALALVVKAHLFSNGNFARDLSHLTLSW